MQDRPCTQTFCGHLQYIHKQKSSCTVWHQVVIQTTSGGVYGTCFSVNALSSLPGASPPLLTSCSPFLMLTVSFLSFLPVDITDYISHTHPELSLA
ncbi:hypothetical protein M404DRAFT_497144 [Pisolithus tinctorius Marx 270]|uniref:Uncharacterized protein n=1 Tax=Pisolithus tinctorius Marx 270 TaxID=870435 RepID=A0A0C3I8F6_PISTI|nr:hypothetical protein M404DRAFT_515021 [Pisolithus tinctorius Marx 270]KIO06182.1 hypothetical protein M404DRAFT_497144 [Pisolithus tinctorius Marx 270]